MPILNLQAILGVSMLVPQCAVGSADSTLLLQQRIGLLIFAPVLSETFLEETHFKV